jgi:hypothetical protein
VFGARLFRKDLVSHREMESERQMMLSDIQHDDGTGILVNLSTKVVK